MKTKAKITFGLVDVTAKRDSTLKVNDKQDFVNINEIKENDIKEIKYGTLERNQFALDGTFESMPEEKDEMCWWSNVMSNDKGVFSTPLVLEIDFTDIHSSVGLTFIFSETGDYCNKLNLKYYDKSGNLISNEDFTPDNYKYVCNNIVENYNKIIVTFYSTNNPYRYLKLYKILYGAEKIFEGDNLMSANILEEIDLLSSEISINTLDFTAYSSDDEFNIINPKGSYKLLQERQPLIVTETMVKENREKDMGTFYLDTWINEKDKTMKITAIDLIGVIDKTDFYGGIYVEIAFKDLIKEIMDSANVLEENYEIEEDLQNIKLTGYIPICSHRKALQQAIFAVGAVADCSRSDKIKIYKVNNSNISNTLDKSNIFQSSRKIEQNELVTGVAVVAHTYIKNQEQEKLFDGIVDAEETEVIFSEPSYNITCEGGTIKESNCNHAIIECVQGSNVIVYGYKYKDNLQTFTIEVENLSRSQKRNTLKVESAYLVNKDNAMEVAKRILDYYQKTYKTSFDFILNDETLTENVALESAFDQQLVGNIIKEDINLTGGFIANMELNAKVKEGTDG